MATTLTGDGGIAQYGSFVFDPATTHTVGIRLTPVQDDAKRTIKYVETEITLRTVIYSEYPATIDDRIRAACRTLTSQGDKLIYSGKGFGQDFNVNINGRKDVLWGPVPKIVSFRIMGNKYAWELTWSVVYRIPECNAARYENTVMAWNFQVEFHLNRYGLTTRTTSGHLEIPQTRTNQGDRTLKHTADEYREKIRPATPPGFYRDDSRVILSKDKCRIDYTFVDRQLPSRNALPAGVVDAHMSMTWDNERTMNMFSWILRFEGEFKMSLDASVSDAQRFFWGICLQRLAKIMQDAKRNDLVLLDKNKAKEQQNKHEDKEWFQEFWDGFKKGFGQAARIAAPGLAAINDLREMANQKHDKDKLPLFFPISFSATEPDIFGTPTARFSVAYRMTFGVASFMTLGLWEPLAGTEDRFWRKSLAETSFSDRGEAGLKFNPSDDIILDLCKTNAAEERVLKANHVPLGRNDDTPPIVGNLSGQNSWLEFENFVKLEEHSATVIHKPIPADNTLRAKQRQENGVHVLKTPAATDRGLNPFDSTDLPSVPTSSQLKTEVDSVVQIRNSPTYYVVLTGSAMRVGWEIQPPELIQIGDSIAVACNDPDEGDGFVQGIVGHVGVPIFGAAWQLRYVLTKRPKSVPTAPHPHFRPHVPVAEGNPIGDLAKFAPEWEHTSSLKSQ